MTTFSEDFSGTLGAWGGPADSSGWAIDSGTGTLEGPTAVDSGNYGTLWYNTATDDVDQFVYVEIPTASAGWTIGVCLRHDAGGANAVDCYAVTVKQGDTRSQILAITNSETGGGAGASLFYDANALSTNFVAGESLGVTVEGTGASTVFSVWHNPSGSANDPSTWGTPTYTFNHTTGQFKDTGSYVGLGTTGGSGSAVEHDNFNGGDYSDAIVVQADSLVYSYTVTDAVLDYSGGAAQYPLTCDSVDFGLVVPNVTLTYDAPGRYTLTASTISIALTIPDAGLSTSVVPYSPTTTSAAGGRSFKLRRYAKRI